MKKSNKSPLAVVIGSTLISGLASTATQANTLSELDTNPFSMSELSTGYMQTAKSDDTSSKKMKDGSCGEGKCGSSMQKGAEEKTVEGKCAGNKPMPKMDKKDKNMEGKCGEGKCGTSM
ncbi:MAG: hypothetical protein GQ532_20355 [Methylomarinum sp.]|nr:hypothetical protein [Methylococcales bacterium]NOR72003.1 hypothetical protein [Methylomarinum sp.]